MFDSLPYRHIWRSAASGKAVGTYTFAVKGYNAVGCGSYGSASAPVSVATPPQPAAPIVGPNPSPDGSYTVSWASVVGADCYDLDEEYSGNWSAHDDLSGLTWATTKTTNGIWNYKVRGCSNETGCGVWSAVAPQLTDRFGDRDAFRQVLV